MYKNNCELIELGICLGCTRSLAEPDWIGKEHCKYYKQIKEKYKNGKRYDYNQITITMPK